MARGTKRSNGATARVLFANSVAFPGRVVEQIYEHTVIGRNLISELTDWIVSINRLGIEEFTKRRFPDCYERLDGSDLRLMRAFLEPEFVSNTLSLLAGDRSFERGSEYRANVKIALSLLRDALGSAASHDTSFVDHQPGARAGKERWFFINGIATSRALAGVNVNRLHALFKRSFTLIHNPTQGFVHDLVESTLQKFTNINTEPVARAFVEITDAILDENVEKVVVIAHSQGTIVMGDVLDLIYCCVDPKYFDRTNMNGEDFRDFMTESHGTVKSHDLLNRKLALGGKVREVCAKLELYMFANGASRMCYLDDDEPLPHIESFANEHDIVTRLGSLAQDEFHEEDVVRIDGPLYRCTRYGHLLNAHYLSRFDANEYELLEPAAVRCIGSSVHHPVKGTPCAKNPRWRSPQGNSKLKAYMAPTPACRAVAD